MLMDCDISVIKSGIDDETVYDNDSPRKTVKMINDAQLTNQKETKETKDSQVKYLLKKIEAASKIQVYLLEKSLPICASESERIVINTDLLKLSKYISQCSERCLKANKAEAESTPPPSTTAVSVSSSRAAHPSKELASSSSLPKPPMLPTPMGATAPHPHTPTRVEKQPTLHDSNMGTSNTLITPSTPVPTSSFDRLFLKLMSPSSKSKSTEKNSPQVSALPSNQSNKLHSIPSVARKLYPDDDSDVDGESESESEPEPKPAPVTHPAVSKTTDANQFHVIASPDVSCGGIETSQSIEDWSQVKQYITRSNSHTPSPIPPSASNSPEVKSQSKCDLDMVGDQVFLSAVASKVLSPERFYNSYEWDDPEQGQYSRPPSPPPEMDEEEDVENIHNLSAGYVSEVSDDTFEDNIINGDTQKNNLLGNLDVSQESCDESFPSPPFAVSSAGSSSSSSDSLRFSVDSPIPVPYGQEPSLSPQESSPGLVIGRSELTWSTEFNHTGGAGLAHLSPSTFLHGRQDHAIRSSGDGSKSISLSNNGVFKSRGLETCEDVISIKSSHEIQNDKVKEHPIPRVEHLRRTALQGLRRNSPSKSALNIDDTENLNEKHSSPKKKLSSTRLMTPPRNATLPGNHLNLRNVSIYFGH